MLPEHIQQAADAAIFQEIILLTALDVLLITRQNVVHGHPALILYATIL